MMTNRVIIAGGSGFLGTSLKKHLESAGYQCTVLTRSRSTPSDFVNWDGKRQGAWSGTLNEADAVINLAGRSVDCRYNAANRAEILESRIDSIRALGTAIRNCHTPPVCWIQATSLAIYGDAGSRVCKENSTLGEGFSVDVCRSWESAFQQEIQQLGETRSVVLRIGFALGPGGGAFSRLAALTRWGLGGTVGRGNQYISWLHIHDLNRLFLWSLTNEIATGVYNATGPSPVTNAHFMRSLRKVMRRPWSPPVPGWLVGIGAWAMRTEASLALTGRKGVPARLQQEGFEFRYTDLEECFRQVLGGTRHDAAAKSVNLPKI